MNKETLIEKLDNWTLAGAQKFYNFVALPELITANSHPDTIDTWEQTDNGIYVISGTSVRYYSNDGTIQTLLTDNYNITYSSETDFEIYNKLYNASKSQELIKFAELTEQLSVDTNKGVAVFKSYQSPDNELGIPEIAEIWKDPVPFNITWVTQYIDQVSWIKSTLAELNLPYPNFLKPSSRLKNSSGYYFYDVSDFTLTYDDFKRNCLEFCNSFNIEIQKQKYMLHNCDLSMVQSITDYAELKWQL